MKQLCSVILFAVVFLMSVSSAQDLSAISVPDIVTCASVSNKQPVGIDSVFAADVNHVSCYTRVVSEAEESVVSHVWFYGDKQMAKIDLKVKAKSFHTWSTKTIVPSWKGDWRVEVQDSAGNVLAKIMFKIQ
jgi:hypothetical protein